eukprot:772195-Amphidinium_carterae.2
MVEDRSSAKDSDHSSARKGLQGGAVSKEPLCRISSTHEKTCRSQAAIKSVGSRSMCARPGHRGDLPYVRLRKSGGSRKSP